MKRIILISTALAAFAAFASPPIQQKSLEDIADAVELMESSILDVSVEYDWRVVPPWTFEEAEAEMQMSMLEVKDGVRNIKLRVSGFEIKQGTKRPYLVEPKRWLIEESSILMMDEGNSWNNLSLESYDGKVYKKLSIGGWPTEGRSGIIATDPNKYQSSLILSPIGFSVFRTGLSNASDRTPLSAMLREENLVRLQPDERQINGFNTICVDFLQEYTKQIVLRIYFSIEHGYTPVRFEYINGHGTPNEKTLTVDVLSLEQVADGLWFPAAGTIGNSDEERINMFQTTDKITVNQGLKKEDFDIKFPPGTEVYDKINDTEYVIMEDNRFDSLIQPRSSLTHYPAAASGQIIRPKCIIQGVPGGCRCMNEMGVPTGQYCWKTVC